MSFWSSILLYRPGTPPRVTVRQLHDLVAEIAALKILSETERFEVKIKFGRAIDHDDNGLMVEHVLAGGILSTWEDIDWDEAHEFSSGTIHDALRCLHSLANKDEHRSIIQRITRRLLGKSTIYRAWISLGTLRTEVCQALSRQGSPENEVDFTPHDVHLSIAPVTLHLLGSDRPVFGGWLQVNFSGPGYLFPWKPRDAVARAEAVPEFQRLVEHCRRIWPVANVVPRAEVISARRHIGDLWPYDDIAKPFDWYWGVNETG